jgi:hypothetical protein
LATLFKVLLLSRKSKLPKANSQELIILGNGPSLKDFLEKHQSFIKGKDTLAVNHFADTDAYQQIKQTYYMINVPEFWTDDVDEDVLKRRNQLIENLIEKTGWKLHLILGTGAKKSKKWLDIPKKNPNIRLFFINPTPVEGFQKFRFFCYKKLCGMPRPHNVLIPSLISGINMGYKKIYLTGADHSWLQDIFVAPDNTVYLTQRHFYDAQTARPDVMKKLGKNKRRLHEILHKFMLSFQAYFDLDAYAKNRNVQIFNITPYSYIDAFQRLNLKDYD